MKRSLSALAAFALAAALSSTAHASFHEIDVDEVCPGTTAHSTAQYIQLRMYAPGQTFVSSGVLKFYDAGGTMTGSYTPTGNVSNGNTGSTILIGTSDVQSTFGVAPDFVTALSLPLAGGAVCWTTSFAGFNDCATWGNFTGAANLPNMTQHPFAPSTGLSLDMAMHRMGADTNDDAHDFVSASPLPTNNAGAEGSINGTVDMASTPHDMAVAPGSHDLSMAANDLATTHTTSNSGGCSMGGTPIAPAFVLGALGLAFALLLLRRRSG